MGIGHWDEVEGRRLEVGPIRLTRIDLGEAAESRKVGVARLLVEPGGRSSPAHVELDEEEIFFVLAGSGLSWQDGKTSEIGAGDCIVHRAGEEAHTLVAGADGLDVLAFGERSWTPATYFPRISALGVDVLLDVSKGPHHWEREAAAGELEAEPAPRPANIVNLDTVAGEYEDRYHMLGKPAGAVRSGLNHIRLDPGESGAPPHCHSAEEEIFVVLEGDGTLVLLPSPQRVLHGVESEEIPIRAGHAVCRPPGTGIAHALRAGENGLTYLAYGTREPNDMCFYPRSNKIYFRGLGLIARLENLEYSDGEPDD